MSVKEDLAGLLHRGSWLKLLGMPFDEQTGQPPVTLAFDRQRIHISMECPRCARSMRLISSSPEEETRGRLTELSWHCDTCGVDSQRTVQC